jgi:hypothetical protein
VESGYSITLFVEDKLLSAFHEKLAYVTPYRKCRSQKCPRKYMFQTEIVVVIVILVLNKGYRSTLGIRDEVRVTIEAFTFLRKGFTKMET